MASEWYYAHGLEPRLGPFSPEQMKALALSGDILPTDTVWKHGVERGAQATRVQHLFTHTLQATKGQATESSEEPPQAPEPTLGAAKAPPHSSSTPAAAHSRRRALAGHGATITSQDGEYVRFRKKCMTCGLEDTSRSMLRILPGPMKAQFFCRKCRKSREVSLRGFQC
jgi:hypothetical protein